MYTKALIFLILIFTWASNCFATNDIVLLRWSDDKSRTRIVLETFLKPTYSINELDDNLDIFIQNGKIKKFDISKNLNKHPNLIKNAIISNQTGGTLFSLRLRKNAIIKHFVIDNDDHPYYRIVIDAIYSSFPNQKIPPKPLHVDIYRDKPSAKPSASVKVAEPKEIDVKVTKKRHVPIIVIDPGHGGKDVGATSSSGVHEKNVTLKYALALKRALDSKKKFKIYITRSRDEFIPLSQRLSKTANLKADLFISIHADSHYDKKLRGLSVYTLSEKASDAEAANLADHENKVDILSDIDIDARHKEVSEVILDMIYHKKQNYAKMFAEFLIKQLSKQVKMLNHSHRYANFKVLRSKHVPSILIELGYLSNLDDEKLLTNDNYKQKIIASIVQAIDHFFNNYSKL
ncbi:MAG: N-acetylmuramoyl-L-alanine amidase [Alphaproteobacteria bacterium]|nr:N-acetylmuramoyl-L-alanine amidase [Alphaproteobacteria bacterium]OJV12034.1 MAG: hypothetical protein BGO27_00410 [Alphaproteobacteria bacterium 33-17]